jgi:putative hydrolase of the HAD superfamily
MQRFKRINVWIFDLDDTLYRAECGLVKQIHDRARQFVCNHFGIAADEADRIRKEYQVAYGTTLFGLMRHEGVSAPRFLEFVHDLDFSVLQPQPDLAAALKQLPGRKIIFTNGPSNHAQRVMEALGLTDVFEDVFDIQAAGYVPKPARQAYDRLVNKFGFSEPAAAMFDDQTDNLVNAQAAGMTCICVAAAPVTRPAHVHFFAPNLTTFISNVCRVVGKPPSN